MAYYLNLFSPETFEAFSHSDRSVSGFRKRQMGMAGRIRPGDKFICYMTKLSRWIGVLEVLEGPYEDDTPVFYPEDDPFVIRFRVRPLVWLPKEKAIPIQEDEIWNHLSFTRNQDKRSSTWTGRIRSSLGQLDHSDGSFLENKLNELSTSTRTFEVDGREYERLLRQRVRTPTKVVSVSVPEDRDVEETTVVPEEPGRESHRIQALIARIGAQMGMRIWLPRSDRHAVAQIWDPPDGALLDALPLNYDEVTLRTVEQIDVLWLRRRSIVRAFEVEHTTSVYSGILRMADLLALQPNMDIRLHLVAPSARRDKVFQEVKRPVFSLLERGPLAESCTYISYESVEELAKLRHLSHLSDSVLDEYTEEAE